MSRGISHDNRAEGARVSYGNIKNGEKLQAHSKAVDLVTATPSAGAENSEPAARPRRIFLLSPANAGGLRAKMILSDRAQFALAARLRREGLPLGEIFSFISGLYSAASWADVQTFAAPVD